MQRGGPAPIAGESAPVDNEPGADVHAGTVNGQGALKVESTRAAGGSHPDRVAQLVTEANSERAWSPAEYCRSGRDRFEFRLPPLKPSRWQPTACPGSHKSQR